MQIHINYIKKEKRRDLIINILLLLCSLLYITNIYMYNLKRIDMC